MNLQIATFTHKLESGKTLDCVLNCTEPSKSKLYIDELDYFCPSRLTAFLEFLKAAEYRSRQLLLDSPGRTKLRRVTVEFAIEGLEGDLTAETNSSTLELRNGDEKLVLSFAEGFDLLNKADDLWRGFA